MIDGQKMIELSKNEIRFVSTILSNNGRIYTVDELLNIIWSEEFELIPDITHLKSLVYRLRKKVPSLHIKNIYGMGYTHDTSS